jgi:hypothetical protein
MKIVKYFAMMAAVVATLASCEDPNDGPGGGQQSTLKATASATTIYADGKDAVSFSVTLDGVPVEAAEVEAYDAANDNVVAMENLTFSTTTPGVYEFYFKHGDNKSNNVEITAVDAKFSKLDLSDVEGQEGLSVMATSTVFQRGQESVFIIVRKDGKVVNDANKIKFYLSGSTEEITDTDFQMVDYVDANDDLYTLPQYTPAQTGVRDIWLSYGSANTKNKPVRITAVDFAIPSRAIDTDPENTSFTSRVLVNQFTGTGCPNCPYWSSALKDLKADEQYKDGFVLAAAHTYNDDMDPKADKVALKEIFRKVGFSALNFTDSRGIFQYYNLKYLYNDIQKVIDNDIRLMNIATQPIEIGTLHLKLTGEAFDNKVAAKPPYYDFKTKHAAVFGGENGYIQTASFVYDDIKEFVSEMI